MRFARWVFLGAGIYGILVLGAGYLSFLSGATDAAFSARPEFAHGFFLVALAWQVAFLLIATDPMRYRLLMLAAMLEKFPFTLASIVLFATGQGDTLLLILGLIDGVIGVLFAISYGLAERQAQPDGG